MIDLTPEQISAAKANDLEAVSAVLAETEERVLQHARHYATVGGRLDHSLMEDLAQVGRVAVWQAVARFEGDTVAQFFTYIDRTVSGALGEERRAVTRPGVTQQAAKDFEKALTMAAGDPHEAERLAVMSEAMGPRRMSPEMAHAARLSWQGVEYLDAPVSGINTNADGAIGTLGDRFESDLGLPDDLVTDKDRENARQREIKGYVHATLGKLGDKARSILTGTFGIDGPTPYFGSDNEAEFAAYLGMPRLTDLRSQRSKALSRFAELYLKGEHPYSA
jgi:DNA-directed RNA polymerase specialized sigma subunit